MSSKTSPAIKATTSSNGANALSELPATPYSTWLIALASALAVWLALPPANLWPLAWVATLGWCWLIAAPKIPARRPYRLLYVVGLLQWLLVIHWIRLPHWSAQFGWIVLAGYLAIYIPLFVGLSRVLVHRMRMPLCISAPIVWTGLEFIRGYLITGFSMALLSHSQVTWTRIVQIADIGGAYMVSFLLVLVAASLAQTLHAILIPSDPDPGRKKTSRRFHWTQALPIGLAVVCVAAAIMYGNQSLPSETLATGTSAIETLADENKPDVVSVALIQGNIDTTFDGSMDPSQTLKDYRRLTTRALTEHPEVDLIVWPESMQTIGWITATPPVQMDPDFPGDEADFQSQLKYGADMCRHEARWFGRNFHTAAVIGSPSYDFGDHPVRRYNSALWLDEDGNERGRYDKMHPVMFGEYVPLGKMFPILYRLTPMGNGLEPGTEPLPIYIQPKIDGKVSDDSQAFIFSPCICYENTVPHLLRNQVRQLAAKGESPDALITISNDGWFWGSSQLDLHLACAVYRAIEMRRPMLIAANTGFSAWIDDRGRVRSQGPRHDEANLVATIERHNQTPSVYEQTGDNVLAIPCAVLCLVAAINGWLGRLKSATAVS